MGRGRTRWLFPSVLGLGLAILPALPASAQNQGLVVRDGTLGSEPPGVVPPGLDDLGEHADYLIRADLGEQRGGNLFHSFGRFSIGRDERATFTGQGAPDPGAIDNVISRVTGGSRSEIDGTLHSTIPGADVWLLNPSGVVFGEGAKLDVPGSFHASTGDYVGFEGGLERFYADLTRPSVLSTARPEAFGFLGESGAAPISVTGALLDVDPGQAIELVGGDVMLTGATLDAPSGAVSIRGGRLVMTEGSKVLAENFGSGPGGSISIAATASADSVIVDDSLLSVSTHSAGDAGTIHVKGPEVTFQNGPGFYFGDPTAPITDAQVTAVGASAETVSSGAGGHIEMDAGSLTITNGASVSSRTVGLDATGRAGAISINADSIDLSARSDISAGAWRSRGDAGVIEIDAGEVTVDGADGYASIWTTSTDAFLSAYAVEDPSVKIPGAPGRIDVEADSVTILNGGTMQSSCVGCDAKIENRAPDAGTLRIVASDLFVDGANALTESSVLVNTFGGEGDSGELSIEAASVDLLNGGSLRAGTQASSGDGGGIHVDAKSVRVTGSSSFGGSGIFSPTGTGGTGNAGSVDIQAGSLLIADRAIINAEAGLGSSGHAGRVRIVADSVLISFPAARIDVSGIFVGGYDSAGTAGIVEIEVGSLVIAPGGGITAEAGPGSISNGGSVTIRADSVHIGPHPDVPRAPGRGSIPRSGITTGSSGSGDAGTVDIRANESILVTYEGGPPFDLHEFLFGRALGGVPFVSGVFSATVGGGAGGSVTLSAPDITITEGAIVATSTVGGGDGGTVELLADRIRVANGAFVDSTSLFDSVAGTSGGDAGSVTLRATESIEVAGRRRVVRRDAEGRDVEVEDWSRVSSASVGSGAAGLVTLTAPLIVVDGGAVATTAVPDADGNEGERGGQIDLDAEQLIVRGGGRIDASTFIVGPGGSIDVTARESIVVEGEGSGIASRTGGAGTGGDVSLAAPRVEVEDGGDLEARSTHGLGELRDIFQGFQLTAPDEATGNAGNITLTAGKLLLDGGTIATNAEASDGGDVEIHAKQLVHLDAGVITAAVRDGAGGNITIDPAVVILQNGSRIVANGGAGSGGNIQITADNYFAFPGSVVDASSELGIDGIVEVHAPDVDLAGKITALPTTFLDAASLMRERCAARRSGERAGSFAVRGNGGIPPEPDGWLPATVSFDAAPDSSATSDLPPGPSGAPLFALGSCR